MLQNHVSEDLNPSGRFVINSMFMLIIYCRGQATLTVSTVNKQHLFISPNTEQCLFPEAIWPCSQCCSIQKSLLLMSFQKQFAAGFSIFHLSYSQIVWHLFFFFSNPSHDVQTLANIFWVTFSINCDWVWVQFSFSNTTTSFFRRFFSYLRRKLYSSIGEMGKVWCIRDVVA